MKKAAVILISFLLFIISLFFFKEALESKVRSDFSQSQTSAPIHSPTPSKARVSNSEETTSEFVPYWTMGEGIDSDSQSLIYFGVSAGVEGIEKDEEGYGQMHRFLALAGDDKEKYLTLRMVDQDKSSRILESKSSQKSLIDDTISEALGSGFDGVVLDLEYKAIPFDSVVKGINDFISSFNKAAKEESLRFSVLVYGDSFYRVRPFDIKHIAQNSDEVMIMTYDFHKAGGNPGPNFPLSGKENYGYDLSEMSEDFLRVVPPEKLTVVLGMFGYDWPVDSENAPVSQATALSFAQMNARFVTGCSFTNCKLTRDEISSENNVTYEDEDGGKHIVWFEDLESVAKKKDFLKTQGINSFSTWAHSYY